MQSLAFKIVLEQLYIKLLYSDNQQFYSLNKVIYILYLQLMSNQSLLKNTFTIYQLKPPFNHHKNITKIPIQSKIANQEVQNNLKQQKQRSLQQRQTTPRLSNHRITVNFSKASDQLINKQVSLPSLLSKSKVSTQIVEPLNSSNSRFYVTKKSTFNTYHKIQKNLNEKYNKNIERIISENRSQKKPLAFLNIHNQQQGFRNKFASQRQNNLKIAKQLNLRKSIQQINANQKHLNRIKNIFYIPLQLQTQRCQQKQYNIDNLNLQLKNKVRFKFDSLKDMYNRESYINENIEKIIKEEYNEIQNKEEYYEIKGWNYELNKDNRPFM